MNLKSVTTELTLIILNVIALFILAIYLINNNEVSYNAHDDKMPITFKKCTLENIDIDMQYTEEITLFTLNNKLDSYLISYKLIPSDITNIENYNIKKEEINNRVHQYNNSNNVIVNNIINNEYEYQISFIKNIKNNDDTEDMFYNKSLNDIIDELKNQNYTCK